MISYIVSLLWDIQKKKKKKKNGDFHFYRRGNCNMWFLA